MTERFLRHLVASVSMTIMFSVAGCRELQEKPHEDKALLAMKAEEMVAYFQTTIPDPRWGEETPGRKEALNDAVRLASEHPDPRGRAIALSFAVFRQRTEKAGNGFDLLREVFTRDDHPVVRRAALRIAGILGPHEENLDLKGFICHERDPSLLRDAVEARTIWNSLSLGDIDIFQLGEGTLCDWIAKGEERWRNWDIEEVDRLREILLEEKDPGLRDAASMALAECYRHWSLYEWKGQKQSPQPRRFPKLKVHEWGVWRDEGETLKPWEKVLADLPSFVHRSDVRAEEIRAYRSYPPMDVFKPLLFFYSPEPVSVLVRVGFFEGRPWTFFPQATDYTERLRGVSWDLSRDEEKEGGTVEFVLERAPPPFTDRDGFSPNWIERGQKLPPEKLIHYWHRATFDEPPKSLGSYYHVAPWLSPWHPKHASVTNTGVVYLASIGLEWSGLRVGYPDSLEGTPPAVPNDHWWSFLREVPSTPVAVSGEREKLLFYDGAVNTPPPVLASWQDASREALVLKVRSFNDYPPVPEGAIERWPEAFRRSGVLGSEREPKSATVPAIFVVQKLPSQEPRGKVLADLGSQAEPPPVPLASLDLAGEALRTRLSDVLTAQGLTAEETRSLVRTWEKEFFLTDSLRVITVHPQWLYHALLPIEIDPVPGEMVRVGLIWKEVDGP